ncbi:hypothetical protein B4U79_12276 [Dinothrombium tinctorium]|uniref:Peptidase S1 domain-containing protein n=1 Tax=Dinothrombium tinctorium TaxID=1965070 RepID=A0A3S3PFY7_9ACAR|nr:hypothetical protein B4U79_15354 [Dinothrombium tinctorium]RWS08878.1 hypothetical protein B4U79_12276 [Dinothrombium tinctorium]
MNLFIFTLTAFAVVAKCDFMRGDIKVDENEDDTKYAVYKPKLSRDDFVLSDPENASLYFDYSKNSHRSESSRAPRALDLDAFLGDAPKKKAIGTRQSRILNDDNPKNKLAIQGFIPIVTLGQQSEPTNSKPEKPEQETNDDPYSGSAEHGFAGPQDAKYIGAALQNFAATLSGKAKRKLGYEPGFNNGFDNRECICVPFYMCKNGFLETTSKNYGTQPPTPEAYEESLLNAQSELQKHSIPAHLSSFYEQQKYLQNNGQHELPLVDERSFDGSHKNNESAPQYVTDVLSKVAGRSNFGSTNCGVLRTCCTVAHDLGIKNPLPLPVYPQGVPVYQSAYQPQIHSGPNRPFLRPQIARPQLGLNLPLLKRKIPNIINQPLLQPYRRDHVPNRIPFQPVYPVRKQHGLRPLGPIPAYGEQVLKPLHVSSISSNHIAPAHQRVCGVRHAVGIHGRVQNLQYHESSTEFGEYPWQVAILKRLGPADSLYVCGATLISDMWVATAAHCIKKNGPSDLKVRLGEWDVHREDEFYPFVEKYIDEIIVHPEFFQGNLVNDIALLRLDSPVDLSLPHIAAACLPDRFEDFSGHRCWVTGWGKDSFGHQGTFQSVLKEVDVPIIQHNECENVLKKTRLGPYYQLHPGFLCAGGEPGKDACEGDGGSPLVCDAGGIWKIAGLVSWGIGCGQPGVPGVYVNVAFYRDWIENMMQQRHAPNAPPPYVSGLIVERSNAKVSNETEDLSKYSIENYKQYNLNNSLPSTATPLSTPS